MENRRDYSVSLLRANIIVFFIAIPVVILQFALFLGLHGVDELEPSWNIVASSAGGDWLILWLIRNVKAGSLVEDHPSKAGCYVLEA